MFSSWKKRISLGPRVNKTLRSLTKKNRNRVGGIRKFPVDSSTTESSSPRFGQNQSHEILRAQKSSRKWPDLRTDRLDIDLRSSHVSIGQFVTVLSGGKSTDRENRTKRNTACSKMYTFCIASARRCTELLIQTDYRHLCRLGELFSCQGLLTANDPTKLPTFTATRPKKSDFRIKRNEKSPLRIFPIRTSNRKTRESTIVV